MKEDTALATPAPSPVPGDFETCVQHAVAQERTIHNFIEGMRSRPLTTVYLVGCGGSHFGTYPAFELLDRYTTDFAAVRISSAELIARDPASLGETSLVVAASHSGGTPETLAAAKFAKEKGATVIGISRQGDNPLGTVADLHLDYPDTVSITEPKLVLNELVAISLLETAPDGPDTSALREGVLALPAALRAVKDEVAEDAARIAEIVSDGSHHYVVGAGPAYGMAKMMAWCYFMEMQWMHSAAVNGADFFHGPLEMVSEETPVIVLLAEDATRGLGQRVVDFVQRYSSRTGVVDTARFSLPGVPEAARADLSVLALMSAERRVLDHVAARRGHDTSQRRYMYKVAY